MRARRSLIVSACALALAACGSSTHSRSTALSTATTVAEATTTPSLAEAGTPGTTPGGAPVPSTTLVPPPTMAPSAGAPPAPATAGGGVAPAPAAPTTSTPARSTATTMAVPTGAVVSSVDNPKYGEIVTDAQGRTLYHFTPDDGASSPQCNSTGGCSQTWPPLKTSGPPRAEGRAKQSLLGVEDGQVTYNGYPLYHYSGDSAPGQTNGEGVAGVWYVLSVNGSPVLG